MSSRTGSQQSWMAGRVQISPPREYAGDVKRIVSAMVGVVSCERRSYKSAGVGDAEEPDVTHAPSPSVERSDTSKGPSSEKASRSVVRFLNGPKA